MNPNITIELRDLGDNLAAESSYRRSSLVHQAAHRIERLEQTIKDLEEMLEDAEHFRDYWFRRVYPESPYFAPKKKVVGR